MKKTAVFDKILIAPCGMNCGTCLAFLREKNKCPGCRDNSLNKSVSVMSCIIPHCENLARTTSGFCYDCAQYPCKRVKQLDKRYSLKYRTSFIENLAMIKEKGLNSFLQFESKRRTCISCGSVLSVHRDNCLVCKRRITDN